MKQLTELELNQVAGGNYEWEQIGVGIAMVGLGIALVSTAGLATIPVALAGAATMGEIGIGAAGIGLAGMGLRRGWRHRWRLKQLKQYKKNQNLKPKTNRVNYV